MAKRANGVASFAWDNVTRELSWDFEKGRVAKFTVPECGLDSRDDMAMVFGYKQTIADAAAKGASVTVDAKFEAMQARIEVLRSGVWQAERGEGNVTYLARAISELKNKPIRDVIAFLAGKTKEQRAALANAKPYAEKIAELRAANVDVGLIETLDAEIDEI